MTNNYVLKLIQRAIDISEVDILKIYKSMDKKITKEDVEDILREEQDEKFILLSDDGFLLFLDGLIEWRRGKSKTKSKKVIKTYLNNNVILKKLRIAFDLKDEQMIKLFSLVEQEITSSELTPYFRKEGHVNFKRCSDSTLKKFIKGYGKLLKKSL
jgi:uncharacterized protein YehS (DUF1456 family)